MVKLVDGVLSIPPKTIIVPLVNVTAPSVSKAAAPPAAPLALPGPLTITTPLVSVNNPLLSIPSVSPLDGTSTSKKPPVTLIAAEALPAVAFTPSSVA